MNAISSSLTILLFLQGVAGGQAAAVDREPGGIQRRSLAAAIGIYHWGGGSGGLSAGLDDIVALNAQIARVTLSARMAIDYNHGSCIPGFTLAAALDDPDVRAALSNPRLKTIIITAYDGAGFGDCVSTSYLTPAFYSERNTDQMVREYSEFVYRLHSLLLGSEKTVIISNWEGDNMIYCGSAYLYTADEGFRAACDQQYPVYYSGNRDSHDTVEGMVLWMRARYHGVALGNARAAAAGLGGPRVLVAPELSAVRMLQAGGYPSVMYDVIPRVPFDYVSYSCYESLDNPDPAAALTADLDQIRLITGSDRLFLGEMGLSRRAMGNGLVTATESVIAAAMAWGVRYIIQWNLYDSNPVEDFGMYDSNGIITEMGRYYRSTLALGDAHGIF